MIEPMKFTIIVDLNFLLWVGAALLFLLWFITPVIFNLPERLKLNAPKPTLPKMVLGLLLGAPWILTTLLLSYLARLTLFVANCLFSLVLKMKAKIW